MSKKKPKSKVFDAQLFKRLLHYIKPYTGFFILALTTVIGLAVFGALRPKVLQLAIDQNIEQKFEPGFLNYMLIMLGLLVLEVTCNLLFIYYASWLGQSVVRDIRIKLFNHILGFKMKYFDNSSVGVLITRTVTDMERIADIFGEGLFMIFSDILKMSVVGAVMFYMNWRLSVIVFFTLPIVLIATKVFQKYMKKAFEDVRTEVSNLNSFVQERITGMKIVQIFAREQIESENFRAINERHKKGWIKTVWYNSVFFPIADLLSSVTLGTVIWLGGLNTVLDQTASIGDLTAFIMMVPMIFRPLNQIANKFNTLQMGMVAADRVFKVLDTTSNIQDRGDGILENVKGDLEFKDVKFAYVENEPVLKGVSFKVNAGETIAIVGATGAGKSTIINLLNRLYDINSGIITIDSRDIKTISVRSLRQNIAVVLQDVFLFADTILNNITLKNPDISEAQVEAAAKEIGIHDFIMSLPKGYHYNVKERGVMLSSGQRQLISFLRAYVTNPKILILDEATASIDSYAEQLIQKATQKITHGRTSIVIAHRLATVQKADTIIVLDAGEIVEMGTHKELLKNNEGQYRNLYDAQFLTKDS
ncbi:MAG: ABC transporter ATP-binding protein [Flavobacteriaceae bacterium]|jgi:ATP-binding cassette subfamily B multidrug efflux pump|nr:ABC transporter ATP-binding protein/permease [Flavobacteriaceae bacterium]MDA7728368.1 ABC transporter ATP-binding protein/permease [Flavobacteriaceae bacterium]MDB0003935.1 ABC transporter ATP-binding protein/permease [Flavobacteriaceae bacterium]MDG1310342.1 ABC transporter ATP-binding protein [Flavobacteriaceae bacterium]